ncbi:MAG TPA: 3-oxoacyl-ACP synthase, partial [Candidatus Baltobacteraceae bacterium]
MTGVKIVAVGRYAPPNIVTNEDFQKWGLDTNDEWISSRTGMKRRHWVDANIATSDLAVEAAQRALDKAGLGPHD